MERQNVFAFLEDTARRIPQAHAVLMTGGQATTFSELFADAVAIRDKLQGSGIRPGTAVAIQAPDGPDFIAALFGVLASGCVVIPVASPADLQTVTARISLSSVIQSTGNADFELKHLQNPTSLAPHISNAAAVRFSSGTTSEPKGVVLSHSTIRARTTTANKLLDLTDKDRIIWTLPMAYHYIVSILLYVRVGATIVKPTHYDADSIVKATNENACTLLYTSPDIIRALLRTSAPTTMPSLRRAISTTGKLDALTCQQFKTKFVLPVSQVYGAIELGLPLANFGGDPPESVGRPAPDFDVHIEGEWSELSMQNQIGRLYIRGPGMFDGYVAPQANRSEVTKDGWFYTGDLAVQTPEGVITILGREKSAIVKEGTYLFPEQIENVLATISGVIESRVIQQRLDEENVQVIAEIVREDHSSLDVEILKAECSIKLSSAHVPDAFRFVSAIPKTNTGKIIR